MYQERASRSGHLKYGVRKTQCWLWGCWEQYCEKTGFCCMKLGHMERQWWWPSGRAPLLVNLLRASTPALTPSCDLDDSLTLPVSVSPSVQLRDWWNKLWGLTNNSAIPFNFRELLKEGCWRQIAAHGETLVKKENHPLQQFKALHSHCF
jgi:hypothetical protein